MKKAIIRMKAYRDKTKWHQSNKYVTMTVTQEHHWMSTVPHYIGVIKFTKVDFTVTMRMVVNYWNRQPMLV